jgi:O-acetyl-ADP-ribose deacetylase (regulator of RNase III)
LRSAAGLGRCATGEAKATGAGELRARFVIHTVGPVWRGGDHGEEGLLASCHRRSLELAADLGARTVAFPAISTGIFGFPVERAALVALRTTRDEIEKRPQIERVTFVLFSDEHLHAFADARSGLIRD